jgi:hypothetical protein
MTSAKRIEANRRNAGKSTGPSTEEGKQRSRCNAVRHGLTAETVIGALEDAEDYRVFEQAIIADYEPQSAVERALILRLASLLWRLRRATAIETGLFEIQTEHFNECRRARQLEPAAREMFYAMLGHSSSGEGDDRRVSEQGIIPAITSSRSPNSADPTIYSGRDLARCFLRLANLPNFLLDRLSRYEVMLWRQADRILVALDGLDRRKPQERCRKRRLFSGIASQLPTHFDEGE